VGASREEHAWAVCSLADILAFGRGAITATGGEGADVFISFQAAEAFEVDGAGTSRIGYSKSAGGAFSFDGAAGGLSAWLWAAGVSGARVADTCGERISVSLLW